MRNRLAPVADVLIASAESLDAVVLQASLHLVFGYDISIRTAATLGAAIERVSEAKPDLLLLEHRLPPAADALSTLAILRSCGCRCPVLVLRDSRNLAGERALLEAGASDVLDRADVSSSRIAEALLRNPAVLAEAAE